MAKTIDHLDFMVDVTPYEHEGNKYDALRISVTYVKGSGFYASWMPVKLNLYGYQTGPLPSSDKLVGGVRFLVERAAKNSSKRLTDMKAALELAKEGIALYFDKRGFEQLNNFMRYVALYGFTPYYQQQVEDLKAAMPNDGGENDNNQNNNNQTSEETTMATKNINESANVQNAQVNNTSNETIDVNVGEVTVDSIMPVMQPVEEKPAVTVPLGDHGTLVIAGVGKSGGESEGQVLDRSGRGESRTCPPDSRKPKVQDSVPQAGQYQYVTYEVKKVNKTTKKEYTVTGSKIVGFELTDPIYLAGPAFCGAISTESVGDKTVGTLRFSHKWTPAVKDVCDLLNSGNATLEGCVAIINGAKVERSERIQERIAKRAERKAERSLSHDPIPEHSSPTRSLSPKGKGSAAGKAATSYSDQDVADMLRKVMAGGDVPENIKKLLAA